MQKAVIPAKQGCHLASIVCVFADHLPRKPGMTDEEETEVTRSSADAGCTGSRSAMTREELYALVWETPMSRLAAKFGLSDVGLRKVCVKHSIPTPPLGYWAKLAHGKPVHQPPLPPSGKDASGTIHFVIQAGRVSPPALAQAQEAALSQESIFPTIVVPSKPPAKLHSVAAETARALRAAKLDNEGFKHGQSPGGVNISIGPDSINRALCIIDAFARAAEERGHRTEEHEKGARIVVDGVPMAWHMYAIKDRVPHQPTKEELEAQARQDVYRARAPVLYSSRRDTKAYRSWDYYPSDRLAMKLTDATRFRWGREGWIGYWHDRKSRKLEDYLDNAMATLATGAVAVKHRLAEEAEQARREAEELERRQLEQARRERALKRHEYLLKKADDYVRFERLAAFAQFMKRQVYRYSDEPLDRLIGELGTLVGVMEQSFDREALKEEVVRLQLYTDDD